MGQSASDTAELAGALVEKADQIRLPKESFQVEVTVTTTAPDKDAEKRKYRILSKGADNTIVLTLEPAVDHGQILLMRGRDLWIFMPNLSQPIRLGLAQRLTGQVANGDLVRTNFAGDYTPRMIGSEPCGAESCYMLELAAVDRSITYHRVLYWIGQTTGRPHRAEFYSLSDRLLKTATYQNFRNLGGKVRPTEITIEDALRTEDRSVLEYVDLKLRDLPDKLFTKEYLKKLDY